jgi:hypothetical protein
MPPGDIGFSEVSNEGELFCLLGFGFWFSCVCTPHIMQGIVYFFSTGL